MLVDEISTAGKTLRDTASSLKLRCAFGESFSGMEGLERTLLHLLWEVIVGCNSCGCEDESENMRGEHDDGFDLDSL